MNIQKVTMNHQLLRQHHELTTKYTPAQEKKSDTILRNAKNWYFFNNFQFYIFDFYLGQVVQYEWSKRFL